MTCYIDRVYLLLQERVITILIWFWNDRSSSWLELECSQSKIELSRECLRCRVLVVSGKGPLTLDQMCRGQSGYGFENDRTHRRGRSPGPLLKCLKPPKCHVGNYRSHGSGRFWRQMPQWTTCEAEALSPGPRSGMSQPALKSFYAVPFAGAPPTSLRLGEPPSRARPSSHPS